MRYTKYLAVIGIVLFLFILYSVGPLEVLNSLSSLDPLSFLAVLLILPIPIVLKAWKQQILLSGTGKRISLWASTKIWLIGFFYATVTPAKAGDFFRAFYLRKSTGLPLGGGIAVTVVERLLDVGYLFLTGLLGLILFSLHYSLDSSIVTALVLFFFVFLVGIFVMTRKNLVSFILKPLFNVFMPEKFKQKMRNSFHDFYQGIRQLASSKKIILAAVVLTIVTWIITFFQYYMIAFALGLPVSFEFILWVMPAVLLIEILPISFSGIGTRDAVAIFFLGFAGVSPGEAVSFSLIILFIAILLAGIGLLFANKMEFKKELNQLA